MRSHLSLSFLKWTLADCCESDPHVVSFSFLATEIIEKRPEIPVAATAVAEGGRRG